MPDLFSAQLSARAPRVTIYTDGACTPNPGRGGWAALLTWTNGSDRSEEKMIAGCESNTTNNRMELRAVVEGLHALDRPCRVRVVSDSKLIVMCARGQWRRKANQDLWQRFDAVAGEHRISFEWVKAHDGHPENERVDAEANRQSRLIASN